VILAEWRVSWYVFWSNQSLAFFLLELIVGQWWSIMIGFIAFVNLIEPRVWWVFDLEMSTSWSLICTLPKEFLPDGYIASYHRRHILAIALSILIMNQTLIGLKACLFTPISSLYINIIFSDRTKWDIFGIRVTINPSCIFYLFFQAQLLVATTTAVDFITPIIAKLGYLITIWVVYLLLQSRAESFYFSAVVGVIYGLLKSTFAFGWKQIFQDIMRRESSSFLICLITNIFKRISFFILFPWITFLSFFLNLS